MAWLNDVELATEMDELQRDILVGELESLAARIQRVEAALSARAEKDPGVALLRTIVGVGVRTGEAVMAYIDDPHRFNRNHQVGSYFGLVPSQDQSADRNRLGHITRQGPPTVRRLLTEAAWQGVRRSPEIRAFFLRAQRGDPERKKIAIVATAHYLVRAMVDRRRSEDHAMLCSGEVWRGASRS